MLICSLACFVSCFFLVLYFFNVLPTVHEQSVCLFCQVSFLCSVLFDIPACFYSIVESLFFVVEVFFVCCLSGQQLLTLSIYWNLSDACMYQVVWCVDD